MSMLSFEPATRTFGWFASTASAGSFCLFCENGVTGLPTVTSASGLTAPATAVTTSMTAPIESTARRMFFISPPFENREANTTATGLSFAEVPSAAFPLTWTEPRVGRRVLMSRYRSRGPLVLGPRDVATRVRNFRERPCICDPGSDRLAELLIQTARKLARTHPPRDLGVVTALRWRVDVDAPEQAGLIEVHHRVGERGVTLELFLMPAEVDEIFLQRQVCRRPAPRFAEQLPDVFAARHHCVVVLDDVVYRERPEAEALGLEHGRLEVRRQERHAAVSSVAHDSGELLDHAGVLRWRDPSRFQPLEVFVGRPTGDCASLSDVNGDRVVEELLEKIARRRDPNALKACGRLL